MSFHARVWPNSIFVSWGLTGGQKTSEEEEDEDEGRSELILQQDMDNDTMDTAIINIDIKLFFSGVFSGPPSGPVE